MCPTERLRRRAQQWRAEAARATSEEMAAFCLDQAVRCERSDPVPAFPGWDKLMF
jgi:hypothetical protein